MKTAATTTPRTAKSGPVKKKPEVPTPKNKVMVNSQKIAKSSVTKTQVVKKAVKKVEEKEKDCEQNGFVILSDQKNNTQVNTNSDQSSKENATPVQEEIKKEVPVVKISFDDDLCNQVE